MATPLEEAITKRYAVLGFAHTMVGGNPHQFVELLGGKMVEIWAYPPDPLTFREEYYYNSTINELFKKDNDPVRWKRISEIVQSDDGAKWDVFPSSSSSSSSSSSASPATPQIILTISGLAGGETYLGLGNGVHTVNPMIYQVSPEAWMRGTYYEFLVLYAFAPWSTIVNFGDRFWVGSIPYDQRLIATFNSSHYVIMSSYYISTYSFSFSPGSVTNKIKNRAFGQLTTAGGATISWQRATNWPSNP